MPKFNIKIQPGCIKVNSLWLVVHHADCFVFEGDLRAKYAEVLSLSETQVYVGKNERTLHTEPGDGLTIIDLGLTTKGHWSLDARVARYSIYIYGYRYDPEPKSARMVYP